MKALTTLLTDIANAIREKKGTTDLINPQDFSTEIRGISGGGNWGYFDTSQTKLSDWTMWLETVPFIFPYLKISGRNGLIIGGFTSFGTYTDIKAVAVDTTSKCLHPNYTGGKLMTVEDMIAPMGGFEELCLQWGFTEITKEQFYDLTTEI